VRRLIRRHVRVYALPALLMWVSGCGGCQRAEDAPGHGGEVQLPSRRQAVQVPVATAGKIQVGAPPPKAVEPEAPPAPPPPAAEDAGAPAEPAAGDCLVVIDATPDYGPPPLGVSFSAEAECSAGQPTFKWNFGDGSAPSVEANPAHTYTAIGEYTASVVVTGPDGATASDEIDITVEEEEAEGEGE
jgi:hypothetical protein